jgi:Collagen triple helix repeat (20 copies)
MTSSSQETTRGGTHRMFSAIRKRLTYANAAMTLALVFAMSGGAYAAKHYLITSTKQISPKVLKSLVGKAGPAGAPGARGAAGPAGSQGPAGAKGENGAAGTNGANGTSVTSKQLSTSEAACGKQGGAEFTAAEGAKTTACDGTTGFTSTLPKGETLKGEWSMTASAAGEYSYVGTGVSFGIPLKVAPVAHYIRTTGDEPFYNATEKKEEERSQPACKGTAEEPTATAGNLCVYASHEENAFKSPLGAFILPAIRPLGTKDFSVSEQNLPEADKFGFGLVTVSEAAGPVQVTGSWAVTAD